MKAIHTSLLVTLLSLLLNSCLTDDGGVNRTFSRADSLMYSAPDSALALIKEIPTTGLSDADDARRRLLLVKASFKSHSTLPDDSVLLPSCRYYAGRSDSLAMQSLLYYGEVLCNKKDYEHALVPLHDAYRMAVDNGDDFYAAMSARSLSVIYGNIFTFSEALRWGTAAKDHFEKAGRRLHAEWMRDIIADACIWGRQYDKAFETLNSADSTLYLNSSAFRHLIMQTRVDLLTSTSDYKGALDQLMKLKADMGSLKSDQWSKVANLNYLLGDYRAASEAADSASLNMTTPRDTLFHHYNSALISAKAGRYEEAYAAAMKWGQGQSDMNESALTHPQTLFLNDYLMTHTREQEARAREARTLNMALCIVVAMLVLIVVLVCIIFRTNLRNRREKEEQLILRLTQLDKEINENKALSSALKAEINALFLEKFNILDSLCNVWYRNPEGVAPNANFRREVVNVLNLIRSDETANEMEQMIDRNCDNWMKKFRRLCPSLKEWQYRMTMYLFVGFSIESIAILLSKPTLNSAYAAKSNLKKAIISSAGSETDSILRDLGF